MGDQANAAGWDRTVGFVKCLPANYPAIRLIERPTNWKPDKATSIAQTIITATPELSAIYMQSDSIMFSGVTSVLRSAGKLGHIFLASIDGAPPALRAIRDGYMDIIVSQPLDLYAQYSVHYAKAALDGKIFRPDLHVWTRSRRTPNRRRHRGPEPGRIAPSREFLSFGRPPI